MGGYVLLMYLVAFLICVFLSLSLNSYYFKSYEDAVGKWKGTDHNPKREEYENANLIHYPGLYISSVIFSFVGILFLIGWHSIDTLFLILLFGFILASIIFYLLLSLALYGLFSYIAPDSKLLRVLMSFITAGIIGGLIDIGEGEWLFGSEGGNGVEATAEVDSGMEGADSITGNSSNSGLTKDGVSQQVLGLSTDLTSVTDWSAADTAEYFSTHSEIGSGVFTEANLEHVDGYVTDKGVEVESYFRTVADGVEWNNLSQ